MAAWTLISVNTNATVGSDYFINTSVSPVYLTLPASPSIGDQIMIADANDFSGNSAIIALNGKTIEGLVGNVTLNQKGLNISLIYNGSTWKRYNLTSSQKKISELDEISSIGVSNNDLMVYVNLETMSSNKIKYSTLRNKVVEGLYSNSAISSLVTDLNTYTNRPLLPVLNVRSFGNNTPAFYRNYNNLTNRPTIPTRTAQLTNDSGFITGLANFSTDQLPEGLTNLYFTNARVDQRLNTQFPELYRTYSNELAETQLSDSFINVNATPIDPIDATGTVTVGQTDVGKFFVGQNVRIFNASIADTYITSLPTISGITKYGLTGSSGNYVRYKLAAFNLNDGKISIATTESSIVYIGTNTLDSFNNTNNVEIELTRANGNHGILVYRSYSPNGNTYELIDVLGQKQLGGISTLSNIRYKDFGNFNSTDWSKKGVRNQFTGTTGIIHVPTIAPSDPLKGWVDTIVASIDTLANRITFEDECYFGVQVKIYQDDTTFIQAAINERFASGIKSLTLNDRRYVVSSLQIPTEGNFTLNGKGRQTTLYKLPWATEDYNKMLFGQGILKNVSFNNFNIDGNMQNQTLKYDDNSATEDYNYAISLGTDSESVSIDKVHINNIIGGGIYIYQPSKILINLNRITDSGMTDLFAYSPLYAPEGNDVTVTNNVFKNFSDSVDLSTTEGGVFQGNIVENTGSGVLVYSSRFFISNPNVIKGPAGEFIASADTLNSEYDSVNITLEANTPFTSPAFTYQENGNAFNLLSNFGSLNYQIDKLLKRDNVETLYGTLPSFMKDVVGTVKTQGEFRFTIPAANVDSILSTYSYSTLKNANTYHAGLVWRALQTEYVVSANVMVATAQTNPGNAGYDKYRVRLRNYDNLAVSSIVRFDGHGGTIGGGTLDNTEGTVLSLLEDIQAEELTVTIQYPSNVTSAGDEGRLRVKNTFVLAKGRII